MIENSLRLETLKSIAETGRKTLLSFLHFRMIPGERRHNHDSHVGCAKVDCITRSEEEQGYMLLGVSQLIQPHAAAAVDVD